MHVVDRILNGELDHTAITEHGYARDAKWSERLGWRFSKAQRGQHYADIAAILLPLMEASAGSRVRKASKILVRASNWSKLQRPHREALRKLDLALLAQTLKIPRSVIAANALFHDFARANYFHKFHSYQTRVENYYDHSIHWDPTTKELSLLHTGEHRPWSFICELHGISEKNVKLKTWSYLSQGFEENDPDENTEIRRVRVRRRHEHDTDNGYSVTLTTDDPAYDSCAARLFTCDLGHSWIRRTAPLEQDPEWIQEDSVGYYLRGRVFTPDLHEVIPNPKRGATAPVQMDQKRFDELTAAINEAIARLVRDSEIDNEEADLLEKEIKEGTCLSFARAVYEQAGGEHFEAGIWPWRTNAMQFAQDQLDHFYDCAPLPECLKDKLKKIMILTRGQLPIWAPREKQNHCN